jgi:urease beta subunit
MPRLVPNPIGDLMSPLQRIEGAIHSLAEKLRPVDSLPDVHEELVEVNRSLAAIHETLKGLRTDLAASQAIQLQAGAAKATAKAPTARTRGAG